MNIARIFDYRRVMQARDMSANRIDKHDFLHHYVYQNLLSSISIDHESFKAILNIGLSSKKVNELLQMHGKNKFILHTDISDKMIKFNLENANGLVCHPENMPFLASSFDLVVSNLFLHNVNDLPGCLIQILNLLKKDGVFICSLFGRNSLIELREAMLEAELLTKSGHSAHIHPFVDVKDMGKLMQRANFHMPVTDSEIVTVYYENLEHLLCDIRGFGERNAMLCRSMKYLGKNFLKNLKAIYQDKFSNEEGKLQVSFEIIQATGIKR